LQVAPANEVNSDSRGVVVTGVDPTGPAAEQGVQTGNVILDVSGNAVASPSDVRKALINAKGQGKRDVLIRLKTGDATKFVAVAIGQKAAG
jgi:serine protease Do